MIPRPAIPPFLRGIVVCPRCRKPLKPRGNRWVCRRPACRAAYPVVGHIPILIDEQSSLFSIEAVLKEKDRGPAAGRSKWNAVLSRFIPSINRNTTSRRNYDRFAGLLYARTPHPRVLVVGGGTLGQGMEPLILRGRMDLVETDVRIGPRTMLVCDAHRLPFASEVFDGVVVQAVLEHVVDPAQCVREIHRVLKSQGLVYAETPFIQQVHMGAYDFQRYTHLGHRRLFRDFDEIDSGAACGPGMALAWSYRYFLLSFVRSRRVRAFLTAFSGFTAFPLVWFDRFLVNRPGALDAASSFYFMGRKNRRPVADRRLVAMYRGLFC